MISGGIFDRIAQWSMILLIGFLPIFFVPVPWVTIVQAKAALVAIFLAIAAVSWLAARLIDGNVRIPASLVLLAGLFLPAAYAISVAVSGLAQVSLVGSGVEQDTLAFACILYGALALSAIIFSGAPRARVFAVRGLYIGALLLLCLKTLYLIFPSISLGSIAIPQTGNVLGTWHEFVIMLGFLIVLGLGLRQSEHTLGVWKYLFYAVALVSAYFLFVANFFDVWVMVGLAALVALTVESLASRAREGRLTFSWRARGLWVALIALALFSVVFGTFVNNVLPTRIRIANVEVRPSWQGTIAISELALTSPAELFFGAGPNTFGREWGLYKPASVNQTAFWDTSFDSGIGFVPTSFVTIGILGILAWLFFAGVLISLAIRSLMRQATGAHNASAASVFAIASAYLLAFHVLYVPGPALSTLIFVCAGILVAHTTHSGLTRTRDLNVRGEGWMSVAKMTGVAVFGLVILVAALGISRVLLAEMLLNRSVVVYNQSKDVQAASRLIAQALFIHSSSARAHRTGVELGLLELRELSAKSGSEDEAARAQLQATLEKTIQHGLSAVAINGDDYQNWLQLAGLYQELAGAKVAGAYENARAAYERARAENPSSPVPLFRLAQLEVLEGHADLALQDLALAVQLKTDFAAAYYFASQIYVSQNNLKDALSAAALTVQYAPNDPLAWYNAGSIAYAAKEYTNAAVTLEKALALEPNYANAAYVLGLSYAQLGRTADALKILEALNTQNPDQPELQKAIADLRAGKKSLPAPAKKN